MKLPVGSEIVHLYTAEGKPITLNTPVTTGRKSRWAAHGHLDVKTAGDPQRGEWVNTDTLHTRDPAGRIVPLRPMKWETWFLDEQGILQR